MIIQNFIKLYLNKTDKSLLESLMHDVIQTGVFKMTAHGHIDPFKAAGPV